jgi:hypothetical protein
VAKAVLHKGKVTRRDGEAVPGALVWVASGATPTPEIAIRCNEEGRFQIALPPGGYVIEAEAADGGIGTTTVETGGDPREIEIVVGIKP